MVRHLIAWSVANPFVVVLLTVALAISGGYAFFAVNVEAYPDPAPAIIEVVTQVPGMSAEEIERQITVPLEVCLAGLRDLDMVRSKSLFGLSHLRIQFTYARDYDQAKQDVINRLTTATLPPGVNPQISPASPIGEILRFTLDNPRDPDGKPIYTLRDLKALMDYTVARELLRVPRIAGISTCGGLTKRYEIQPDPARLARFGISLAQLSAAIGNANANGSGDNLTQGPTTLVVRTLGLFGQGQDPQQMVLGMTSARRAAELLRKEEARRCLEIRQVVVATVNAVPVRIDQLVDGGPMLNPDGTPRVDDALSVVSQGVLVSNQTRQGKTGLSRVTLHEDGSRTTEDFDDVVHAVALLRKGQESLPALHDLLKKIDDLNESGLLLPEVKIVPVYDRSEMIHRTTATVHENLLLGMILVTVILLMFLSNVRAALIVALNVPLALIFAFGVMFVRGKSANLLSIGAVDFGIIVDASVIIVESIYRRLTTIEEPLPLGERIVRACAEVERSLFFATIIMVVALIPLFAMKGPEGQIFGPMADTYAFALGGALLLAVTVSPALCVIFFKGLKPARDNFLVRWIKSFFQWQLEVVLRHRWIALAAFLALLSYTAVMAVGMGREFMPELEEGNILLRGTYPLNISFDEVTLRTRQMRGLLREFPELRSFASNIGRPDDGTDPTGLYNVECNIPLRPEKEWPAVAELGRPRTKPELVEAIKASLFGNIPGVDWDCSQMIRDNVMEALSGVKGENSVKIFGPDLNKLEELADKVSEELRAVPGVENPGVFHTRGQSNLEFPVDRQKCARWNVSANDVQDTVAVAVAGKAVTQMLEGGKSFDVTVRFPGRLRADERAILNIPVPVLNQVAERDPLTTGQGVAPPAPTGTTIGTPALTPVVATRRLADLVTPLNARGQQDPSGSFLRPGASTIYRENGQRLIAIKFSVSGRDLAATVAEARQKIDPLFQAPYQSAWSGEFQEMEEAEGRLLRFFALSLVVILILLFLAFNSVLDTITVCANVLAVTIGGIWALRITGLNLNVSTAVGFISILGVAVMNGLLIVSAFNAFRARGLSVDDAVRAGVDKCLRPLVMTPLTAILGLLPAALATGIGSQSQRPLAIVVVGGMLCTIIMFNLIPLLYSFYGHREPPAGSGDMAH
jgi:cobalt-zinc-cadmium resistance protein CzcA